MHVRLYLLYDYVQRCEDTVSVELHDKLDDDEDAAAAADDDDDDYKTGLFPHLSGHWFICILQANMFNVDARLGCFESFLNQQQRQKQ